MKIIIAVLACWCLFNSLEIRLNSKGDRQADVMDKITNDILKLQDERITKLEKYTNVVTGTLVNHNKAFKKITDIIVKMNEDE